MLVDDSILSRAQLSSQPSSMNWLQTLILYELYIGRLTYATGSQHV
jgi:hypothetical protein